MDNSENIICISSIDWDFVWQGHQEIMSAFARNGNRVLFIENTGIRFPKFKDTPRLKKRILDWFKSTRGFRKETKNLYVYSPLMLPFPYSRAARWVNKHMLVKPLLNWMKVMDFYDPIVWTFLPTGIALDIINSVENKLLIYYCIADFYQLADNPKKVRRTEDELIKKSDLIFTQGKILQQRCLALNRNVHIFPFGVRMEVFKEPGPLGTGCPVDIKGIKRPIIGYIGGVHRHIDFALLRYVAEKHPEWSIVLVGPEQTNTAVLKGTRNIFVTGKKEFRQLPYYINEFDVCIIPYVKSTYTDTVYPTKLNEYHAMGKPVISTDLPEVRNFNAENDNLILIGRSHEEFVAQISAALKDENRALIQARKFSSRKNSWDSRIEEMSGLIEEAIEVKNRQAIDWQENFLKIYRTARRKLLKLLSISLCAYLLVFYTSFIWFAAKPLRISQPPQKADCIVVFAGGVGESGKAGQGYEERVEYAVKLYKKGYAGHLIFSSGYRYVLKEPLLMKVLAISMGVPEYAVLLEEKAANTYENVKFTKEILDKNNWNSILLVSSPYHMRRASWVFNKIAKDTKVTYVPILNSIFYSRPNKYLRQINLQQIKGILHECLGILYYWWQRYI